MAEYLILGLFGVIVKPITPDYRARLVTGTRKLPLKNFKDQAN